MSAVYLGAVEPWVFRPTVVRELYCSTPYLWRERTVPPVVPSFDEPCPDCRGIGAIIPMEPWDAPRCPTCGGSGVVQRVWRAERQWRVVQTQDTSWTGRKGDIITEWISDPEVNIRPPMIAERRLAVVSWYPVNTWPVVDIESLLAPTETVTCDGYGGVIGPDGEDFTAEPWAADLTPGCVVVIPGDEHKLDTPITKMWHNFVTPLGPMTVPLALSDGLNDVELA